MKSSEIPALKLLLLLITSSFSFSLLGMKSFTVIILSVILLIIGISFIYFKQINYSYFLMVLAVGLLISSRFDTMKINIPDKIIPQQQAVCKGKVLNITKIDSGYVRYLVYGSIDMQSLPEIKDINYLLTIFKPKFILEPGQNLLADIKINFVEGKFPGDNFNISAYHLSNEVVFDAIASGDDAVKSGDIDYFINLSYKMRTYIKRQIFLVFDSDTAPIMSALITGDKSFIDSETKKEFSITGTAHLLAVSGLHVGIISAVIFTLFSFVSSRLLKSICSLTVLWIFVYMTGWLDSAVRAAFMISVYLLSINIQQKVHPLNSLSLAALIMFLINPDIIFSLSYKMSVLSVAGIIIFHHRFTLLFINKHTKTYTKAVLTSIGLTLSATVLISPMIAYYFGNFSIIAPLANFLVIPVMLLAMCLGIAALVISVISLELSFIFATASGFFTDITGRVITFASNLPSAYIEGFESLIISVLFSLGVVYVLLSTKKRQPYFRITVSMAFIMIAFLLIKDNNSGNMPQIVPGRDNSVVILSKQNKKYVLILDRKPANNYSISFPLYRYLLDNSNVSAYYTGNSGLAVIEKVRKEKDIQNYEIDNAIQGKIIPLLNFNINPIKHIEL